MSDQPKPSDLKPKQDPGSLADLLDMVTYDEQDIQAAVDWWDEHASDGWVGALEE